MVRMAGTRRRAVMLPALLAAALLVAGVGSALGAGFDFTLKARQENTLKRLSVRASCYEQDCDARIGGKIVIRKGGKTKTYALRTRTPSLDSQTYYRLGLRLRHPHKGRDVKSMIRAGANAKAKLIGRAIATDGTRVKRKAKVELTG